jgi:hypothetical protein
MAKTTIKITIEDHYDGPRIEIEGDIKHSFDIMYPAMGYAAYSVAGAAEEEATPVSLTAGTYLPQLKKN